MEKKLIELIINPISKKYNLHAEICYKDSYSHIDDIYFSCNSIRIGGLDICRYINEMYGLEIDEGKIILKEWIKDRLKIDDKDYDFNKLWFISNKNYSNLSCSGVTSVDYFYINL
jgi:hypothetical protein